MPNKPEQEQSYYLEVLHSKEHITCADLDCHIDKDGKLSMIFFRVDGEKYKFEVVFDGNFRIMKKSGK